MTSTLTYEWRRISTVPGTWIISALVVLLSAALETLIVSVSGGNSDPRDNLVTALTLPLLLGGFLFAAFGAQALGQEYRFGTIRATLTLFPVRPRVYAAKLLVTAAVSLVVYAGAAGTCVLVALLSGDGLSFGDGPAGGVAGVLARTVLVVFGWLVWGFAIAGLTRNTALGVVLPIVIAYVVEVPLLAILSGRLPWLVHVLPFTNAGTAGTVSDDAWPSLAVFGGWSLVAAVAAYLAFTYRDA